MEVLGSSPNGVQIYLSKKRRGEIPYESATNLLSGSKKNWNFIKFILVMSVGCYLEDLNFNLEYVGKQRLCLIFQPFIS